MYERSMFDDKKVSFDFKNLANTICSARLLMYFIFYWYNLPS
jgi:hypothetical protein